MTDIPLTFSDELSDFDYVMFRGESNPKTRSTLLSVMTLETSPNFSELTEVIDRASRTFIRLRQKVVEPSKNYVAPRWVVDPDFDLDYHLRRVSLASPGNKDELLTLASQLNSTPFDVSRPLWEFTFVDRLNLPNAKAALIIKLHHAVTDGVGAMMLLQELIETSAKAPKREMPLAPVPEDLDAEQVTKLGVKQGIGQLIPSTRRNVDLGIKAITKGLTSPKDTLFDVLEYGESAKRLLGNANLHQSPLLQGRSLSRDLGIIEIPLSDIRKGAKAARATVNDAFLAAVSLGLKKYHEQHLIKIEQLSISMPVNTRPSGASSGGNHFAGVRINLPLNEDDALACIAAVSERSAEARSEPAISLVNHLMPIFSRLPNKNSNDASRTFLKPDVQLSNVQGYPKATYLAGAKVTKLVPFGPVPGVASMITMVSYDGSCFVGLHSDRAAIKNFEMFEECIKFGFDEIIKLAALPQKARKTETNQAPSVRRKTAKSAGGITIKSKAKTSTNPEPKALRSKRRKTATKAKKVSAKQQANTDQEKS